MKIIKPVRPMTYDKVFKNVLQDISNEDYLIDLISRITKISKKESIELLFDFLNGKKN